MVGKAVPDSDSGEDEEPQGAGWRSGLVPERPLGHPGAAGPDGFRDPARGPPQGPRPGECARTAPAARLSCAVGTDEHGGA